MRSRHDILQNMADIDDVDTAKCYLCRTSNPGSDIGRVKVCTKCYRKYHLLKEIEHT